MSKSERYVGKSGTVTWRVRFRHGVNRAGTGPRMTSETFANKRDAEHFVKLLAALGPQGALDQLYAGEQESNVPTLDQVAADHIAHLTGIESGTRLNYERLWHRTWSPLLGSMPANHVTADVIATAVNALGERYSAKSLANQRGLLSAVMARAVDKGHLPSNPVKRIRLPRARETERAEMVILDPAQFAEVLERADPHFRPLLRFLYGTGCRWGEAVALQVQDVSLGERGSTVRVRRALKWSPDANRTVGPTKTRRSNRTIAVAGQLVDDLEAAVKGKGRTELVFTAQQGGQVHHRTFWSRVWLKAAGDLDPRPRIHDLRHSHASWLLGQGVPIHVVQARLGHESIKTTVDTYSHLMPDAQSAAAAAAELAFGPRRIG